MTRNLTKNQLVATLTAIATTVVVTFAALPNSQPAAPVAPALPVQASSTASEEAPLARRTPRRPQSSAAQPTQADPWPLGEQRQYSYEATRTMRLSAEAGQTEAMEIGLSGRWVVTAVDRDEDQLHVHAVLQAPKLSIAGPRDAARAELLAALSTPHYLTFGPRGRLEAAHFPAVVAPMPRMLLKAIAAQAQFVRPRRATATWALEETDLMGEVVVQYAAGEEPGEYRKAKRRYTRVATAEGLMPPERVGQFAPRHSAAFWLDEAGRPDAVHSVGSLSVVAGGGAFRVTSSEKADLELQAVVTASDLVGAFLRDWSDLATVAIAAGDDLAALGDQREPLPAEVTVASLTDALTAIGPEEGQREMELIETLGQLFRERAGALDRAVEAMVDGVPVGVAKAMAAAMGTAGTPASQAALGQIASNGELVTDLRENAVQGLALQPKPTAETVATLTALLDDPNEDVAAGASLALGAAARVAGADGGDPFLALVDKMRGAETLGEQILYLEAIGNSGDPRAFTLLKDALAHPHPAIRAAAVGSLRFIPTAAADALISATLLGDEVSEVRLQAAAALTFRPMPPAMPAIGTALSADPAPVVRAEVAGLLGRRFDEAPGAGDLLAWAAENDPDAEVREAAVVALKSVTL